VQPCIVDPRCKKSLDRCLLGFTQAECDRAYELLAAKLAMLHEALDDEPAPLPVPAPAHPVQPQRVRMDRWAPAQQHMQQQFLTLDQRMAEDMAARDANTLDAVPDAMDEAVRIWRLVNTDNVSVTGTDPLDWWRGIAIAYPMIAKVARLFLAIPASSAPSERVFSTLNRASGGLRGALSPERVQMIVRMHENLRKRSTAHVEVNPTVVIDRARRVDDNLLNIVDMN